MANDRAQWLIDNGFAFHGRIRGASGICWTIGSKPTSGRDSHGRLFVAQGYRGNTLYKCTFRFLATDSALSTAYVNDLIGDPDLFFVESGTYRFRNLLKLQDLEPGDFPDQNLSSRSPSEEFTMHKDDWLEREISRVRFDLLDILRRIAFTKGGRTAKAEVVSGVCTSDEILDQTLRQADKNRWIKGALSDEMKITNEGLTEYERLANERKAEQAIEVPAVPEEPPAPVNAADEHEYDVFISHASEDKKDLVEPLTNKLQEAGLTVWYDAFVLTVGDSLLKKITEGLKKSRFGVVIFSKSFFAKPWPQQELAGLHAKSVGKDKVILPVRHGLSHEELVAHSPIMADLLATDTSKGLDVVANELLEAIEADKS